MTNGSMQVNLVLFNQSFFDYCKNLDYHYFILLFNRILWTISPRQYFVINFQQLQLFLWYWRRSRVCAQWAWLWIDFISIWKFNLKPKTFVQCATFCATENSFNWNALIEKKTTTTTFKWQKKGRREFITIFQLITTIINQIALTFWLDTAEKNAIIDDCGLNTHFNCQLCTNFIY